MDLVHSQAVVPIVYPVRRRQRQAPTHTATSMTGLSSILGGEGLAESFAGVNLYVQVDLTHISRMSAVCQALAIKIQAVDFALQAFASMPRLC